MDIVHLLPDHVANQIAAGEVIQRPASCLKELVENSLDAGATNIQVIVRDAGRTLLQVIDNGKGMSQTDARMAFERHATSKISRVEDLFSLRTMGFRGEALASICAVAQVEMTTRRQEDEVGVCLEIDGSKLVHQEPCACPVGTNLKVKNLFYNVPVRRKFLKTDQTELRNLLTEFYHIVLVYPRVQFTFVHNDEVLLDLPAGNEKQRIEAIFGRGRTHAFTSNLIDLRTDTELVSIRGFVSKPEASGKNPQQYFFVNGRYMRHPYFHKAILTAYSGMLPGDYAPSYFIYFDIAPEAIDVNIHPTKTEIKFADEQAIFQILMAAVREAIGKFSLAPTIDFNREGELEMPLPTAPGNTTSPRSGTGMPHIQVDPTYNPFHRTQPATPRNWTTLYPDRPAAPALSDDAQLPLYEHDIPTGIPYQYADRYILLPTRDGLLIINQHRAHICVEYEALLQQLREQQGVSQQLLFQEILDLTPDEMAAMETILPDLRAIGFAIDRFSKTSYGISGVPAQLPQSDALMMVRDILQAVMETGTDVQQRWQEQIALSLARSIAIPYGKILTQEEMQDLCDRLLALKTYSRTPDGKRVVTLLSNNELENRL